MQEEIEQKSFNIMISTTKLSARTVLRAVKAALRLYQSKASQGKQSVRTLLRQNRGVSSVEISKTGIRGLERYAKKYGIDYAIRKDTSEVPPRYLVFFKAPDALMKNKIIGVCPNCGKPVVEREKGWFCENRECRFVLWKDNAFFKRLGKRLDSHVADKLLRDSRVRLKDCKSAKGKTYNATVLLGTEVDGRSKFSLEFEGGC